MDPTNSPQVPLPFHGNHRFETAPREGLLLGRLKAHAKKTRNNLWSSLFLFGFPDYRSRCKGD